MTRRGLPVRVPCGVCTETIADWAPAADGSMVAVPCGDPERAIWDEIGQVERVELGQYAESEAR